MKGNICKRALAACLALTLVSGGVPAQTGLFASESVRASADSGSNSKFEVTTEQGSINPDLNLDPDHGEGVQGQNGNAGEDSEAGTKPIMPDDSHTDLQGEGAQAEKPSGEGARDEKPSDEGAQDEKPSDEGEGSQSGNGESGEIGQSGNYENPGIEQAPSTITIINNLVQYATVTAKVNGETVTSATAGTEVTLTVTLDKGYALKSLTVTDAGGNAVDVTDNKFTMPNCNVTVGAEFVPASGTCGRTESDKVKWALTKNNDGNNTYTLTISGTGAMSDSANANWNNYHTQITKVVIESGVTSIGFQAFYQCSSLTSVTIPNSVTSIGLQAFLNCDSLTSVTIPNSVTSIGNHAFCDCDSLTSVTIPNSVTSIRDYAFCDCDSLSSVTIPHSVTSIGESAFEFCRKLTTVVVLAENPPTLGDKAFWVDGAPGNANIYVPAESIDKYQNWTNHKIIGLYFVDLPEVVTGGTVTADKAFVAANAEDKTVTLTVTPDEGYALKSLTVTDADNNAVDVTDNKFTMPNRNVTVSAEFMRVSGTCGKTAEDNVTWALTKNNEDGDTYTLTISGTGDMKDYYDDYAPWYIFYRSIITKVVIESGVTSIGEFAFCFCDNLTSVTIPSGVTSIGKAAFSFCSSLTSVTIPSSVTSIGDYAFCDCSSLTSVTIPNSVTSIGESAFEGCSELTTVVVLAENPPKLGVKAFWVNNAPGNANFYVPAASAETYKSKENWKYYNFTDLYFVTLPASISGGTVTADTTEGYAAEGDTVTLTVTPDEGYALKSLTVTDADNNAVDVTDNKFTMPTRDVTVRAEFMQVSGTCGKKVKWALTKNNDSNNTYTLTISGTGDMSEYAYDNWYNYCTQITKVVIESGVTTIGCKAFEKTGLTSVTIPNSVTSIGDYAFAESKLTSVVIPKSVTTIMNGAFVECSSLQSVYIPKSVTTIEDFAFAYCRNLSSVAVRADYPPQIGTSSFTNISNDAVFYVPVASIKAYQNAISSNNIHVAGAYFVDLPADTEKGTVTANKVFVPSEDWNNLVTLTVTPKPGYKVKNVSYTKTNGYTQSLTAVGKGTYRFNMQNDDVTVQAEFEAAPTVNAANVTLGGELGLNFFLTVPDELVNAGAKAVLEGPDGKKEFVLADTPKDSDGDYKVTYKLKAIFADQNVSLKLVDSNGAAIKLYNKTSGEELDDDMLKYSIYDYVKAFTAEDSHATEKEQKVAKTMYSFIAYSAKWKYGTLVPEDVTAPKKLDSEDFKMYEPKIIGTIPDGIELTALSLVLDSNTALRLYFTCTGKISDCPVTLDGKALTVKPSKDGDNEYYVDIENIGAKKLKNTFDIKFGDDFTVKVSPMSYVCNTLIDGTAGEDVMNVLKALCAYSDAVDEYVSANN